MNHISLYIYTKYIKVNNHVATFIFWKELMSYSFLSEKNITIGIHPLIMKKYILLDILKELTF